MVLWTRMARLSFQQPLTTPIHRLISWFIRWTILTMYSRIWIPNFASMGKRLSRNLVWKNVSSISSSSAREMITSLLSTIIVLLVVSPLMFINFAHSLDLYRGYAAIVAGEEFPVSDFEAQYCLATSRRANAHYVYSEEDLLAKYSQQFKVKKIMSSGLCGTSRRLPLYADNSESTRNGANDCWFRTTSRIGYEDLTSFIC